MNSPCLVAVLLAQLALFLAASEQQVASQTSFVHDVLPVLGKAGCSGSSCHSKPGGQNGFKLSVFSYDPKADYEAIVSGRKGRRVSPSAPEQSLILLKATATLPHQGGERFKSNSEAYRVIKRWIEEGMVYQTGQDSPLEGIELQPVDYLATKEQKQQLRVIARYANKQEREVTQYAQFRSSREELATVDGSGLVKTLSRSGEAVISAQFMGQVAIARITIPPDQALPVERYASLPTDHFLDALAFERWRKLGLYPSDLSDDSTFLRRVSLDLIGRVPSAAEAREFLADSRPDKRSQCIDRLLRHPGYADHWAIKWADLLRPNPDRVGVKSVYVIDQWLRNAFRENMPMDAFARAFLTAKGSTHRHGPTVVYRDRRTPEDLASLFSQVFLGTRLECARCHHHPNEKWSQEDFYQMAAFFGQVKQKGTGVSPPISGSAEVFYHAPGGSVAHPVTHAVIAPKPPDGPSAKIADGADPRGWFADWLTDPANPIFAKAIVNRVWGELMGRGIVHPVDDFRATNPPTNPALLDALAKEFVAQRYDLKALLRTITNSRLYQLSSEPGEHNLGDTENFARSYRRRLSAESLADAVADITGIPRQFDGLPERSRAAQVWNYKIESDFLDAFGRPNSSSDCPCERNLGTSIVQALHLMHSEDLQDMLTDEKGLCAKLAKSERSELEIIQELYLAAYSRPPSQEEADLASQAFRQKDASRRAATEDILWALLNTAEFVFNH